MYIANKIYYFNLKINGSDALSPMEDCQLRSSNNLTQKHTSFGVNASDDVKSEKNQKTNIPNIFSKKQIVNFKDIMDEKIKIHPYESSESNHEQIVQKIDDSTIINENFFLVDQCIPSEQDRLGRQETQVKIVSSNVFLMPNDTNDLPNNIQDRFSKIKLPKITYLPKESKDPVQIKSNQDINYDKIFPSKQITQISKQFKLFKKIEGKLFAVTSMIKLDRKQAFAFQSSFNKLFSEFKHLRYTILWVINSLTSGLCFDNQQNKMINKTMYLQAIHSDLDLISFIKNNQELKKLKMIVLQEKQLLLFNVQPRKIIKIAEEEEINLHDLERASKKKSNVSNKDEPKYEYKQIQEAYQWCKSDQNMDEIQISINNKLIEALGVELKSTLAQIK